ncbi:hypothetical protein Ac2012v2_007399 [Leucoagaricus gongylophorus]
MDMSKIQMTRFTSALILFIFTGAVFFSGVGATRIPGHHSQCNTGPVQCCHQSFDSNSHEVKNLLALNNIGLGVLSGVTGMVGAECTPITALGVGSGGNCAGQTVCCTRNGLAGAISVGCNNFNVGL